MRARMAIGAVCLTAFVLGVQAAVRAPVFALAGPNWGLRWTTWVLAGTCSVALVRRGFHPIACIAFAIAGAALMIEEAAGPGASTSLALSAGLCAGGVAAGLGIAAVAATTSVGRGRRSLVAVALAGAALGGPMVALARDPRATGCFACQRNLLTIGGDRDLANLLARAGGAITVVVSLVGLATVRAAWRRAVRGWPVALAMWAAAVAAAVLLEWPRIADGADAHAVGTTRAAGAACLGVAAAGLWEQPIEARRRRRALAQLMARVAAAPLAGSLEIQLGATLGDPRLRLRYPLDDGRLIDASGALTARLSGPVANIERDASVIALVEHTAGRLDDPAELLTLTAAAGIAIDHEREAAVLAFRAHVLADSRRRLIEASDRERRALERDLHDHAQQRLVSILIGLRMQMSATGADDVALRTVSVEVQAALDNVRLIGRGIFPSVLAEEGLAVALEELALGTGTLKIARVPEQRVDPVIEATAYLIADACSGAPTAGGVRLAVDNSDRTLILRADGVHSAAGTFESLAARTVALGGTWTSRPDTLEVVLPCGS